MASIPEGQAEEIVVALRFDPELFARSIARRPVAGHYLRRRNSLDADLVHRELTKTLFDHI